MYFSCVCGLHAYLCTRMMDCCVYHMLQGCICMCTRIMDFCVYHMFQGCNYIYIYVQEWWLLCLLYIMPQGYICMCIRMMDCCVYHVLQGYIACTRRMVGWCVDRVFQGYLYKKSHGLNKEWKKKYCALTEDGKLAYHPSLHVSPCWQWFIL